MSWLSVGRWSPLRLSRRLRDTYRGADDVRFSLQLALFVWRLPDRMAQQPLPAFLEDLRRAPRPPAPDLRASVERIDRLSRPWFATVFRARNTCYVRSLMFCRFADAGERALRIHFVVEPRRGDRLRGHAWVSAGNEYCEPPKPEWLSAATRFYSYPAEDGAA
ncbi:MAG: lasso peptide biosynthesis protein [Deltaproteobacteria bacterium]|nr:lasso peptide biosynthesis protein [Deltaproteobacteria bacterium]